jgi:hypothetical protein
MINDGINNVPDKTIAVFTDPFETSLSSKEKNRLSNILEKPPKKREWFTPHFYRCLPLTIGNQYGFVVKSEFDFAFTWDGGNEKESILFDFFEDLEKINQKYPRIETHFGSGIITINPPYILKTPPGVNLMTMNPPNYIIPNITVMTGVVEADNLRRGFTFNLKIQIPNIKVFVPAGTPLAAAVPIPRYYGDSFELKLAEDIFSEDVIDEELQATQDVEVYRKEVEPGLPNGVGRQYFKGEDIYGNKFPDHQKP